MTITNSYLQNNDNRKNLRLRHHLLPRIPAQREAADSADAVFQDRAGTVRRGRRVPRPQGAADPRGGEGHRQGFSARGGARTADVEVARGAALRTADPRIEIREAGYEAVGPPCGGGTPARRNPHPVSAICRTGQ